jgi:hypothetical protein
MRARAAAVVALGFAAVVGVAIGYAALRSEVCLSAREIFLGVAYGCEVLPSTGEGSGVVRWVRVDLSAPGIELYVTQLDPSAVSEGFEYRLRRINEVVQGDRLSVAINGTLFSSVPRWRPRLPGDLAKGVETIVSTHVVNHLWEHTYLLWFDDALTPHLRPSKPPAAADLAQAMWGIGGQAVGLHDGEVSRFSDRKPDARTAIAIDQRRKLLFLAVAEWISPHLMLQKLAELGAREGMLLDGGSSSAMAIGQGARGIPPTTLLGGWRPVATYFGIRARPLPDSQSTRGR